MRCAPARLKGSTPGPSDHSPEAGTVEDSEGLVAPVARAQHVTAAPHVCGDQHPSLHIMSTTGAHRTRADTLMPCHV